MADEIIKIVGSTSDKTYLPPRPGDVHDSLAGLEKISEDIGFSPALDIKEGLMNSYEWLKDIGEST